MAWASRNGFVQSARQYADSMFYDEGPVSLFLSESCFEDEGSSMCGSKTQSLLAVG